MKPGWGSRKVQLERVGGVCVSELGYGGNVRGQGVRKVKKKR